MIQDYVNYCADTGLVTWKQSGKEVGGYRHGKYRSFRLKGKQYSTHRVAWFLAHGYWPNKIDHIDGDPSNNKLVNLRDTTSRGNSSNLPVHRQGKSVGCSYYPKRREWLSRIYVQGKSVFLGWYKTEAEAHQAYVNYRGTL